jgi:N-acetylglutamate synthase
VSSPHGGALSPDDVGGRVSVRRRVDAGVADVVGDLETLDADGLAIRRPDGVLVHVEAAAVVAARVVGPSPRAARELEAVSGRCWPATDEAWLGRWWLRAADGFSARANSTRPLGDPGVPIGDALDHVVAWYAERGLPPMLRVIKGSSTDDELSRRGWTQALETVMQTATLAVMRGRLIGVRPASVVQVSSAPTASWLQRYHDGAATSATLAVLTGAPNVGFATIEAPDPAGTAVAIGRAAVEAPWVGLAAIEVDPHARRLGHGRAIVSALVEWAAANGAGRCYLEAHAENAAALALYASLGLAEHHRYTYRRPPPAA